MDLEVNNLYDEIKISIPLFLKKSKVIAEEHSVDSKILIIEMIKYFIITKKHDGNTSPSHIIDLVWHELILFTKFYEQFCTKNFGEFIHHTPTESSDKNIYITTLNKYKKSFGIPPESIWGTHIFIEWNHANCGACHN